MNFRNRDLRCSHGFYRGLCTDTKCPHYDGGSFYGVCKTVTHEAWGKKRKIKEKSSETPL